MKKYNRRWHIVVNLAPCGCVASVVYSRTLPCVLAAKHDLDSRCIHRLQTKRFAYLTKHKLHGIF